MELFNRAENLYKSGDISGALRLYEEAVAKEPSNYFALYALGSLFSQMGRNGLAIPLLQRSLEENPNQPECLNNLAVSLRLEGHEETADEVYGMALILQPDNHETWCNRAGAHVNNGDPEKCLEYAEKSLSINPEYPQALYHKSLALLEMGRLKEGFALYEWRKKIKEYTPRSYTWPRWDGKPVKRLLIHGEQGIGDELLFMSFHNRIQAEEVTVECTKKLEVLFKRTFPNWRIVTTEEEANKYEFDAVVAMGDLPNLLGVTPCGEKYLVPDAQKVAYYRSKRGDAPLIGLSWYGGLKQTHTHLRNAPPKYWQNLAKYNCTTLQYGPAREGAVILGIPDWQPEEDDLDDRAALIAACDLVITVCNTTVHMAGALGVPCWCIVPDKPAWRYGLTGDSLPWYNSVKLYRQRNGWDSVFNQLEKDLADFAGVPGNSRKTA